MVATELPKFQRVKRALISQIESGKLRAGDGFPSEADLLGQFDVSRPTLVRALQQMVAEGYLVRQRGRGSFVSATLPTSLRQAGPSASRRQATPDVELPPIGVFLSQTVAGLTGVGREVHIRILRGVQQALAPVAREPIVRQVETGVVDAETLQFLEVSTPGVALVIEPAFNLALVAALKAKGWQVWSVNEPLRDVNSIFIDHEEAGYLATKFLLAEGRRRIALLNGPSDGFWGFAARRRGYERAMREAEVEIDPSLIREMEHAIDSEAGRAMMRALIIEKVEVDGVVGVSDSKGIGAQAAALEAGLSIPRQIHFVTIDNTLAGTASPPLSAVAMPFEEIGYQAAIQALSALSRKPSPQQAVIHVGVLPVLIER
ncbi:MAG: GntR family transcriptional regulator [Tepidisphaeraceae bacterium]